MRTFYVLLLIGTLLAAFWTTFLYRMLPFGAFESLYGGYRAELAEELGWDRANHFAGEAGRSAASSAGAGVLLVGLPLLATNAAWAGLAWWLLRRAGADPFLSKGAESVAPGP